MGLFNQRYTYNTMIKKFLAIALAVLTLAACTPEYGFEDIPLVIEELVTSGEGYLLSRADGKETQHKYSFDVTETEVKITATLSKSDKEWVVGYFILPSSMLKEVIGDCDLSDWETFHSTTADSWSTYAPGEWVDASGNSTSWDKGHVYWFYQNFADYEGFSMKDALCIGHNPDNDVVGETITSKCVINGIPFNVTVTVVD